MQAKIVHVSREMETLGMNQKEMTEITEIKNVFDGLITRLNTAKESIRLKIYQQKLKKLKCKEGI